MKRFVQYLPPYSPDFNHIELSFIVIKVCISRLVLGCVNIVKYRRGSSGISYIFAICIQISKPFYGWQLFTVVAIDLHAQYRHSANGVYLEREQWERVRGRIQASEQGEDLIWDVEDNGPEYDLQFNSI
jgi:hypothetical protein